MRLLNVVVNILRPPRSFWELPRAIEETIVMYARLEPRMYTAHRDYFSVVRAAAREIPRVLERLWERAPGEEKMLLICWRNRLSRKKPSAICITVRAGRHEGRIMLEEVAIGKYSIEEPYGGNMVFLESPSPQELARKLEELAEKEPRYRLF